jgi:hypothetical protein
VAREWLNWCTRWRSISALSPRTRRTYHRTLFLAGTWLAEAHPDVCSLERWTRSLAAEYVAALDRTTVGQWGNISALDPAAIGKPISARTKECRLMAARVFFRNLQERAGSRVDSTRGAILLHRALCGGSSDPIHV